MSSVAVRRDLTVSLESVVQQVGDHVGWRYRGDAERDAFSIPLVAAAVEADTGVIHVCDRITPHQVATQLVRAGVDVERGIARGQIQIFESTEANSCCS